MDEMKSIKIAIFSWTLLAVLSCSAKPETLLQVERLLGGTPEELIARLGEPKQNRAETEGDFGFLSWPDIEGTQVLVVVKEGKGVYVSYRFVGMEAFDQAAALALIGVEEPDADPKPVAGSQAQRWQPFGEYERMTINPDTRLISVGSHPIAKGSAAPAGAGAGAE
jgi:hypothetical protein